MFMKNLFIEKNYKRVDFSQRTDDVFYKNSVVWKKVTEGINGRGKSPES
jgi:hypothetical protein